MSADTDHLTAALARRVIGQIAPAELPLFGSVSRAWFGTRHPGRGRGREHPLGFGPETVATLLTPVVLAICGEVVRQLREEMETSLTRHVSKRAGRTAGRLLARFRRARTAALPAALTTDQLVGVRRLALERGLELGLPRGRAEVLADAIVGSLTLTPHDTEAPAAPVPD